MALGNPREPRNNSTMNTHNTKDHKPLLAITMGDPAGIGPEIIVRGWRRFAHDADCRYVVFGSVTCMRRAAQAMTLKLDVVEVDHPAEAAAIDSSAVVCVECCDPEVEFVLPGAIDSVAGKAAVDSINAAITATLDGFTDGIVTAPINKAAINQAGCDFPGHTELLAQRCGVTEFAMMLYIPEGQDVGGEIGLGVVHTTLHQSLRSAIDDLSSEGILSKIKLAQDFASDLLSYLGISRPPRIAVAALNPHAGEGGLFGDEETRIIQPAIDQGRALGFQCTGPHSCDTLMGRAASGEFDMVVAMIHDQGHIALKLLGMHKAVNVTLGLPIVRTSVAHGTAFEIAGKGTADCTSLTRAVEVAKRLLLQKHTAGKRVCR